MTLVACQSGQCRKVEKSLPPIETPEQVAARLSGKKETKEMKNIFVYKYDGSLQCGQGRKIPLKEMASQLEGIKIYSKVNKPDGLMHIQVCGSPTGYANVFEISPNDLEKAQENGFKVWEFEE